MTEFNQYNPVVVSMPCETIRDICAERGITFVKFTELMQLDYNTSVEIFMSDPVITDEIAEKLASVVGSTKQFWLARDARYQESLKI